MWDPRRGRTVVNRFALIVVSRGWFARIRHVCQFVCYSSLRIVEVKLASLTRYARAAGTIRRAAGGTLRGGLAYMDEGGMFHHS